MLYIYIYIYIYIYYVYIYYIHNTMITMLSQDLPALPDGVSQLRAPGDQQRDPRGLRGDE